MKLKELVHTIRNKMEALDSAVDYDLPTAVAVRVQHLERESQVRDTDLAALSERVDVLAEQVRQLVQTGAA